MCEFEEYCYRITWSGRFRLVCEICKKCGKTRNRSIAIREVKSTYPSKEWFRSPKKQVE